MTEGRDSVSRDRPRWLPRSLRRQLLLGVLSVVSVVLVFTLPDMLSSVRLTTIAGAHWMNEALALCGARNVMAALPGVASGPTPTESCAIGKVGDTGTSGFRLERKLTNCPIGSFNSRTLLNVGQKVSYQNATCAVGGDGLVACLDTASDSTGLC